MLGIAGVEGNGQAELVESIMAMRPGATGTVELSGKDLSSESTRERRESGVGFIPEDRQRHGLLLDAPLWENRVLGHQGRPPSAKGPLIDKRGARAAIPNGSSRSTTSARPARTCWPGRSPEATSRSSSSAAR